MSDTTPTPTPTPTPAAPARRGRRWLRATLAGLLVLIVLVVGAGAWLWHSGAVQARLLQAVPGLSLEGYQGRATGGPLAIERLRWQDSAMTVELDGLQWQDLALSWRPHAGAWIGLTLVQPQARAVRVVRQPGGAAPPGGPLQAPENLRLPLAFSAQGLKLGSVQLDGQEVLSALAADIDLAADGGALHRISRLQLSRPDVQVTGELSIGTGGDLPLAARLALATPAGQPLALQGTVQASGPLRRLQVETKLRTEAGAEFSAQAGVAAFADWPLVALAFSAKDLDLSRLASGLPQTALSGSGELGDVSAGQPLRLKLALDNSKPGPWDAGRLPVRSAHGTLQGRPSEPDRLVFDGWVIGLGRSAADGQLALRGTWQAAQLDMQLQMQKVQAAQLDTRAPRAVIDGALTLALTGLAVPGSAAAASAQALEGSAELALQGRLAAPDGGGRAPPPLALRSVLAFGVPTDGSLTFELRQLEASAGAARATATLNARRDATGAWALKSDGKLDQLNLAAWWPEGGASNLNGSWQADLRLPKAPPADMLAALRGAATVELARSQLAGVALSGTASVQAQAQGPVIAAQLQVAGNRLQIDGKSDTAALAPGARQRWRAELQAPALAALAPLLAKVPGAKGWLPEAGGLQATATAAGPWPLLRSEGRLQIDGLRLPQARLDKAQLRWTFNGLTLDAPMSLDAELSGLAQAERRLDRLQASLSGSLREHRLRVEADSPLRPPAWADVAAIGPADTPTGTPTGTPASGPARTPASVVAAAPAAAPGSVLLLQAQGRWQPVSPTAQALPGAGEWRGGVTTLRAGPRAAGAAPWLSARDLAARVTLDASGRPTQAVLSPGRIEAFGAALAWQQAQWLAPERPGGAPRVTLEAKLEPLKVAPILARLQPDLAWRGDLVIGGRASVRSGARFDADISIERQGGDLGLTLAGSQRELGLSTVRVALAAHDGQWVLSQALVGQPLGVFGGSQKLETTVDALMPPPQTPLQGGFSLRVADAGIWAPWLPPGWRLGGEVAASVSLGGQLGEPTFTGELLGEKLAVRNIFEGVNLSDGSVLVRLDASEAVVERFHFKGGEDGALDLNGRISYADAPQADLKLVLARFQALDRVDRRVALSGNADIGLRAGRLSVKGSVAIDNGLVDVTADDAPSLSDDVVVVGRTDAKGRPVPDVDGGDAARRGALASTDIDLRLALGDALRLRGRGLDALLRGQLRITTTDAGKLLVRGVINTAEGSYTAYGQNLAIKRGSISFAGDVANPRLDILALRADLDNPIGVIVSGPAADPRVRLYSDPDLPEVDQLTWLLTGEAPQGQGRDESALLQRAAMALLAGDRGASNEGFLQKLGVDQFGVGRSDGGDTVVTVGKQLSKRLSIVYEKGLAAAGGTWSLLYRVAGRTTLRARTGLDNAVEVIWSWRWD